MKTLQLLKADHVLRLVDSATSSPIFEDQQANDLGFL